MFKLLLLVSMMLGGVLLYATQQTAPINYQYVSAGNGVAHIVLALHADKHFTLTTEWLPTEDSSAQQFSFKGTYQEAQNVFDLQFEHKCDSSGCHALTNEDFEEVASQASGVTRVAGKANVLRMNKEPQQLRFYWLLMQLGKDVS